MKDDTNQMKPLREDVQRMVNTPGVYIGTDTNNPGLIVPIISLRGSLFSIKLDQELNPNGFFDSARFAGPYPPPPLPPTAA